MTDEVWGALYPNFTKGEMSCKCGCGLMNMDPDTMEVLQNLRDYLERGVVVNSGSRCQKHNKDMGGGENSRHLTGLAVDVGISGSVEREEVLGFLYKEEMVRGKGPANGFVHFDVDQSREVRVCWLY